MAAGAVTCMRAVQLQYRGVKHKADIPPPPPFSCNAWIKISDPFDCGTGSAWHRPTEQDTACGFSGVGLGS